MKYDVAIIGGGSGGLNIAAGAAAFGAKIALIEKSKLGGDCLHYGCVPSKTLIKSAKVAHYTRNSEKYGIDANLNPVDFSKVAKRIQDVIKKIEKHDSPERFEKIGVDVIFGEPKFISKNEIQIGRKKIKAKKFVIATGSHPFVPPIKGIEKVNYLTNMNVFSLKELPESLGIIGGGPIGSEMAQAFARLGSKVTIFEGSDYILSREDKDIAKELEKTFRKEGIKIHTNSRVVEVKDKEIIAETGKKKIREKVDKIFIATGQRPATEEINLEAAGVELKEKGGIKVNDKMQTTNKNIYACGDVVGPYQFTHIAEYHAKTIVWNLFFPFKRKVNYDIVPWTTFTDPELARVGMGEKEAKENGYEIYTLKGKEVDRFLSEGYEEGIAKIIVSKGKLKGVSLLLPNAGELLHEFILAMQQDTKVTDLAQMIHVYPTMAQANKQVVNKHVKEKYLTPMTKKLAKFFFRFQ